VPVATPLSTSGRFIVDANGQRVKLAGVNWYGANENLGLPPGLDRADLPTLARTIASLGFNCVRFPFSLWMTEQTDPVPGQYLAANPDLTGATPMQVYDACVNALTDAGLIVIPNCHLLYCGWCCADSDANGLWYNDNWPAEKFFGVWQDIAVRYDANPLVAAMDIKNEPRPATVGGKVAKPTWGTGDGTDFAALYTQIGNLIHEINPDPLIICEGLSFATDLTGVASDPIRLDQPGKVVYSMHDYSWFHPSGQSQPDYAEQMNKAGGYILSEQIAPLWVGEFGTATGSLANFGLPSDTSTGTTNPANTGQWWTNAQAWLTGNDVDWCWWALNPVHGQATTPVTSKPDYAWGDPEPFGLLAADWLGAANQTVMGLLQDMVPPASGPG
jgi:endoglucanase